MRYTRTAITQLTKMYRSVLKKCAFLNALILTGVVAASPSWADYIDYINTETTAFQFGDVSIAGQEYMDNTAFGGRRGAWTDGKYLNTFPQYQLEGRSFGLSGSKAYVGPVELTLRELTDADHLIYNYQLNGDDVDLANLAHVDFGNTQSEIVAGVAGVIGADNAQYTAPGVVAFANRDDSKAAGSMTITNSNMVIDGATVNANTINVSSSNLTFAKKGADLLTAGLSPEVRFYTNAASIDSDGKSALNADTMTFDGSRVVVNAGAELTINPTTSATISNATTEGNGGAVYNQGTMNIGSSTFDGNTTASRGGAIFNYGTTSIDGATFTGNRTTSTSYPSQGGAIYNAGDVEYLDKYGILTISNSTFGDANDNTKGNIAMQGGAISNDSGNGYNAELTLNNTNFYYNKAQSSADGGYSALGGAIHSTLNDADVIVNGDTTFKGNSAIGYSAEGGAIYNSSWGKFTFNDTVTFDSNIAEDTNGANGGQGGAISNADGTMVFKDLATFTNNKAIGDGQTSGGALYNANETTFENGATFTGNEAMYGGAIFNGGTVNLTDASFTDNTAGDEGGAIFTYGGTVNINAVNSDVAFSSNTANGNANDITNYKSTINLNAASGKTIALEGGIDGLASMVAQNKVNITGAGTVEASTIKNQTVAVKGGELHLSNGEADGSNLAGSTVTVASGAIANTIDKTINNYSDKITLADGAKVKLDADLTGTGTIDTFAGSGSINIDGVNITSDGAGGSLTVAAGATIVVAENTTAYTTDKKYKVTGSASAGDGNITITQQTGAGGLEQAVDDTVPGTTQTVTYNLTNNDTVDSDVKVEKANFTINGDGTGALDKGVTLTAELGVDGNSTLTIDNTKIAGDGGSLSNDAGGTVNINESNIGVNMNINGTTTVKDTTFDHSVIHVGANGKLISDPTVYNGGVIVLDDPTAVVTTDGDTFQNTDRTGYNGGAIDASAGGSVTLTNNTVTNNKADAGAGIYAGANANTSITGGAFTSNSAVAGNGGAIYNAGALTVTDANFDTNTATGLGGAIYSTAAATINATGANVSFTGNTAGGNANDIYMQGADGADVTLALNAADGKSITLGSGIGGQYYDINVNATTTGNVALGDVAGVDAITVGGGAVSATTVDANALTLNDGTFTTTGVSTIDTLNTAAGKTFTANADLTVQGGTNAGTINGTGNVTLLGADMTNAGTISGTGTTTIGNGVDAAKLTNSGTITGSDIVISANATLNTAADTVTDADGIANAGTLNLAGGAGAGTAKALTSAMTGTGTTNITGFVTNDKSIAQGTVNVGTDDGLTVVAGNLANSAAIAADVVVNNQSTLTNNATGVIGSADPADIATDDYSLTVGTHATATNSGTINVAELGTWGNFTNAAGATINATGIENTFDGTANTGVFTNAGTINGNITNKAGATGVAGTFTNAATGTINGQFINQTGGTYTNNNKSLGAVGNFGTFNNAGQQGTRLGTVADYAAGVTNNANATLNNNANGDIFYVVNNANGTVNNAEGATIKHIDNGGAVVNNGTITGGIENYAGATLTSNASNITSASNYFKNDGTVTFTGGTIQRDIAKVTAGGGIVEIAGDVAVSANKTITDNSVKLTSGKFDVTALADSGAIDLSTLGTGLVANGGTLSVVDNAYETVTLGDVNTTAGNLNVAIDAALTSTGDPAVGQADVISIAAGKAVTGTNTIDISNIHITTEPVKTEFTFQVADDSAKANVSLSKTTITAGTDIPTASIGNLLLSYDNTTGIITGGHSDLANAINSTLATKAYTMGADEVVAANSVLAGTSLSITGGNTTAAGDLTVGDGKTLTLNNTTFAADLANAGNLNLGGTTTINGKVSGVGGATVLADSTVAINDTFTQNSLTIAAPSDGEHATTVTANASNLIIATGIDNDGTLSLTGGTLASAVSGDGSTVIDGTVSSTAAISNTAGITVKAATTADPSVASQLTIGASNVGAAVDNDGKLILQAGELAKAVSGDGATEVTGAVTVNNTTGSIAQDIDITAGSLTANADKLTGDDINIKYDAELTLTGGELDANINGYTVDPLDPTTTTYGALRVTGDTTLNGTTTVDALTVADDITLDADDDVTVNTTLANTGTITGAGDLTLLGAAMSNAGTISAASVTVGDGTNAAAFTNNGTIGSATTDTNVTVSDNAALTNNANKTITGNVTNDGTVTNNGDITGNVTNNAGATATNAGKIAGNVTNNAGATFTTAGVDNVDDPQTGVTGTIANDGALTLTDGTVVGAVTGTGTTTISGAVENGASITGNNIAVAAGGKLTTAADTITDKDGSIANAGTLELTGGDLNQNVTGGNLDINGDVAIATTADVVSTSATTIEAGKTLTAGDKAVTLGDTTINGTLDVGTNDNVTTGNTTVGATGSVGVKITDLANGSSTYTGGQLNVNGNLTTDSDSKLKLDIADGLLEDQHSHSGSLDVVDVAGTGGFTGDQIEVSGDYEVTVNPNGSIVIVNKNSYADVSNAAIGSANNVATATGWDNATNLPDGSLARDIQKTLNKISKNNPGAYVNALTNLAPTDSALYQSVALEVSNLINEQVTDRLKSQGMNSGDVFERQGAWVKTFYSHAEQDSDRSTPGFTGKTKGIAFGLDGQVDENTTVGVGYSYNTTDADSLNRDIDITGHNIFAYGKYQPSSWFVRGMVNYGLSDYEEKSHVLGFVKTADYDVKNYGFRTYVGYDLPNGFTPEAGLRYTHLTVENYMDSLGQVVRTDDIDILTATLGVNFQKDVETFGYKWTPKAHFGVTYDLANDGADASVVLGNSAYNINGEALDRFGIEAGVGAEINMGDWSLSAEYEYGYRDNFENHTGMLQLKYNF